MLQGNRSVQIGSVTKWNCWNFVNVWANISTSIFWYNDPSHGAFGKRSQVMWPCLSKIDVHLWGIHEILKGYVRNWTQLEGCTLNVILLKKLLSFVQSTYHL